STPLAHAPARATRRRGPTTIDRLCALLAPGVARCGSVRARGSTTVPHHAVKPCVSGEPEGSDGACVSRQRSLSVTADTYTHVLLDDRELAHGLLASDLSSAARSGA